MTDIYTLIGNYGFPIAVCVWLLYERTRTMNSLEKAIQNNTEALIELKEKIKNLVE